MSALVPVCSPPRGGSLGGAEVQLDALKPYRLRAPVTLQLGAEARLELERLRDEGVDALSHLGRRAHVRVERQPEVGLGDIPLAWLGSGLGSGSG